MVRRRCPKACFGARFAWAACLLLLLGGLVPSGPAAAHADLEVRIAELTKQIEAAPADAGLYLKRGELHRKHQDWAAALADFGKAESLGTEALNLHYARGRLHFEAGNDADALTDLALFLAERPGHAHARIMQALLLGRQGRHPEAVNHYETGLAALRAPTPENYLELANLYLAAGPDHLDQALQSIDRGIGRLGPVVSLVKYASDLAFESGRYQESLARLGLLPDALAASPHWIARKGEILMAAGRDEEAEAAFRASLAEIESLPAQRQGSRAMQSLRERIALFLEAL